MIFLSPICRCNQWQKYIIRFLLAFGYSRWLVSKGVFLRQKFSQTSPHFRPLFLLIVETLLWRLVICDLFVNSQKDGCLLVFFVGYQVRGLFQSRRFGLKNYNLVTSFPPMLRNRHSQCLPSVEYLFKELLLHLYYNKPLMGVKSPFSMARI